jgi:hypothetical protein
MENEQHQTFEMPEMWKTSRLCNCACKGFNIIAATASRREADCYLHGMFPEEKIVNGSNQLKKSDGELLYHLFSILSLRNSIPY